jgi:hypothetical protein
VDQTPSLAFQLSNQKINLSWPVAIDQTLAEKYTKKFNSFNQWTGEKYLLEYNTHAENYAEFYSKLNINFILPASNWLNPKMPVNKFTMIENLQQVLDAYKSIDVEYNFNDDVTIAHIENILKERQ